MTSERVVEPCGSKDTESVMTLQDQIVKAETLWALKTASENFSFRVSDGVPELFQKMFPDSTTAKHMTMTIQQKLDLDEIVFLRHVESRWLSLLPAVERVKSQLPALLEYSKKVKYK